MQREATREILTGKWHDQIPIFKYHSDCHVKNRVLGPNAGRFLEAGRPKVALEWSRETWVVQPRLVVLEMEVISLIVLYSFQKSNISLKENLVHRARLSSCMNWSWESFWCSGKLHQLQLSQGIMLTLSGINSWTSWVAIRSSRKHQVDPVFSKNTVQSLREFSFLEHCISFPTD